MSETGPPAVVAFCAPGNEMLAAVTCNLFSVPVSGVFADESLSDDDLIVADLEKLGILRADRGPAARSWLRLAMARAREEVGRQQWIKDVRERLGLVTMAEEAV